jgi:hypothetical protein
MTTNSNHSYVEKCIQALPPEKQESARQAFLELGEGDGSAISKLLVVLEANAAFASTIPSEMNRISEKFVRELTEIQARGSKDRAEAEARLTSKLGDIIQRQVPALGKSLAVDRLAAAAGQQKHSLTRLERSINRLRHLRVGGVLALMLLGIVMTDGIIAAIMWNRIQVARGNERFFNRLNRSGIELRLIRQGDGSTLLRIEGPVYRGTAWRLDKHDKIKGVDLAIREAR